MHALYDRFETVTDEVDFTPAVRPAATAFKPSPTLDLAPSHMRSNPRSGPNWGALGAIIGLHALGLIALMKLGVIQVSRPHTEPLVVELLSLTPPPQAIPPSPEQKPLPEAKPQIVAPPRLVAVAAPSPPVQVVAVAPPPQPVPVARPVSTGPVTVDKLASKMISASPPRYPIESRLLREQGTVYLSVLLDRDGTVAEIVVARSSGFERLDKAALAAVRHWHWSPTIRAGEPVMVRGTVDIPFVLKV
jgi:periplasmic protein TonB